MIRKTLYFLLVSVAGLATLLATTWAVGALYFDLPITWLRAPLAFIYGGAMLAILIFVKGRWRAIGLVASGFVVVLRLYETVRGPAPPTSERPFSAIA